MPGLQPDDLWLLWLTPCNTKNPGPMMSGVTILLRLQHSRSMGMQLSGIVTTGITSDCA